jgi:hypothetical protein
MEQDWEQDLQYLPDPSEHAKECCEWFRDALEALDSTEAVQSSTKK